MNFRNFHTFLETNLEYGADVYFKQIGNDTWNIL